MFLSSRKIFAFVCFLIFTLFPLSQKLAKADSAKPATKAIEHIASPDTAELLPIEKTADDEQTGTGEASTKKKLSERINIDALNFDEEGIDWHTDWWKIMLIALASAVILILIVRACMMLLKLMGVVICLGLSTLISFLLHSSMLPWVTDIAPEPLTALIEPKYITFFVTFLIGLMVSAIVGRIVHNVLSGKNQKNMGLW